MADGERETWLSPSARAWEATFGKGSFRIGMAARMLQPLYRAGHSPETIGSHLSVYLEKTDPQYASLRRFVETFALWGPKPEKKEDVLVDDTGVVVG